MLTLEPRAPQAPSSTARDVVLLVDDQPEILASLRRLLADESFEVVTTTSPREALRRAARGDVSLVVTDERMPRVRGTDLLERIRKRSPGTLRVVLTAFPGSYTLQYGLSHGVDWLLSKPWNDDALKLTIRQLLDRRNREGTPAPAADADVESLGEAFPLPLLLLDAGGELRWANAPFRDLVGRTRQELAGLPFADLHADPALAERLSRHEPVRGLAARLRRKDGREVDVLLDLGGRRGELALLGVREAGRTDVEATLLQGQRLQAVGELAAGLAHEINTPVGYILSNLATMQEYRDDLVRAFRDGAKGIDVPFLLEDFGAAARDCRQGAERIRDLVKGLREFLQADPGDRGPADVQACLENALRLCWNELKYKVELVKDYLPMPAVRGPGRRLEQVFVNLLVNAGQAIEKRGRIHLGLRLEDGRVAVRVRDTGGGMSPDVQGRLFEPFFTTKRGGTGLGLHVARRIVADLGGSLDAASAPGAGSEFVVRLPLAGGAA